MTARSKTVIKSYFQQGLRPTQDNFGDLVDSYIDTLNPTITNPTLEDAILTSARANLINNVVITTAASTATLTILGGKTATINNSIALTGTDGATLNYGAGGTITYPETGTWTPAITFATPGNLSVAYSTQLGNYIKIGRLVVLNFFITTSSFTHTTASGNLNITGVPYQSDLAAGLQANGSLRFQGITKANYTQYTPQITAGSTTVSITAGGSGQAVASVQTGDVPTGGTVNLAGTLIYMTNS